MFLAKMLIEILFFLNSKVGEEGFAICIFKLGNRRDVYCKKDWFVILCLKMMLA